MKMASKENGIVFHFESWVLCELKLEVNLSYSGLLNGVIMKGGLKEVTR